MKLVSTRNPAIEASFVTAVVENMPLGGGLFSPQAWPTFADWDALLELPFQARATEILRRILGDELDRRAIEQVVQEAFDFPVPLRKLGRGRYVLELFCGPSLAFKDFGARFLARVLEQISAAQKPRARTVLTATSGDTGAAVAQAFWKVPGFRVVILYPQGRVSPLQERQFASLGENVQALAVEGSFDDCQVLVKRCFADAALTKELGLLSANSINFARLLAQTLYYTEGVAQLRGEGILEPPVFSVPSGNFGNLCAGLLAQRLGLPVRGFVAATNANDTVPEFLETGHYRPRASVPTLSNAMDVGDPSNWERIEHLFGNDLASLRRALRWGRFSDAQTVDVLRKLNREGYLCDPHGAVAYGVLERNLSPEEVGIFLATAHPAKFREVIADVLGAEVELPESLKRLLDRPVLSRPVPSDLDALRSIIKGTATFKE